MAPAMNVGVGHGRHLAQAEAREANVALRERVASMSDIIEHYSARGQPVPPWLVEMFGKWLSEARPDVEHETRA